ncbi:MULTISPECIES: hypothetical protein [unclassified Corynebacterium]|uniref:hypothetical protein n=1 Tax=unclassified Corynebacterium TaxID=2624378 RepID=UPI002AA0A018|nr:hypothetical protein [Mycobacteriaceae bacterium]MDY5830148.1 hypothetical protein [Corynebacterium sp.]
MTTPEWNNSESRNYGQGYGYQNQNPNQGTPYGQPGYAGAGPQAGFQSGTVYAPTPPDAPGAVGQGFKGYFQNFGPWFGAAVVYLVLQFLPMIPFALVVALTGILETEGTASTGSATMGAAFIVLLLLGACVFLVGLWMYVNFYHGAVEEANGQRVSFRGLFRFDGGRVGTMVTVAVYGILVWLGCFFFIIPGLFIAFLLCWVPVIKAEDPSKGIGAAMWESYRLSTQNIGTTLLLVVLLVLLQMAASLIPIVGSLVVLPVLFFAWVLTYRSLTQRPAARW